MIRRLAPGAVAVVLAALAPPALGGAWDASPIDLTPGVEDSSSEPANVQVAVTPDGAVWTAWFEYDPTNAGRYVVRRVAPDGTVGERRAFAGGGIQNFYAQDALAVAGDDSVRFAYLLAPGLGNKLVARTFTPTDTSGELVLYDASLVTNGGRVLGPLQLRAAPAGATWALWVREDNASPAAEARLIDADGQLGGVAPLGLAYEAAGAVDADGKLIAALGLGGPGRVVAAKVEPDGSVGTPTEVQPTTTGAIAEQVRIERAGDVATIVWIQNKLGRHLQARRLATSTMTAQGAATTPLDDGVAEFYEQRDPVLAVMPGGNALLAWHETDSSNHDEFVRLLAAGDLGDTGVVGDRLQLDGGPPQNAYPNAVAATDGGSFVVFNYGDGGCRAIDVGTGDAVASDVVLGPACSLPSGPADGSAGLASAWYTNSHYRAQMSRFVTTAPTCSNSAPVTVDHGATVKLAYACSGWRPVPQIVASPALGTIGPVDLTARTILYTAGAESGGSDQVRYRGTNAAGSSAEATIPITVNGPGPAPPSPPPPPGADTSDRTPPAVSRLRLAPRRPRHGKRRALKLSLRLSEPARVTITITRRAKRIRRITLSLPAGPRTVVIVPSGRARRLAVGRHTLTASATDAAGNRSATARITFSVRRR